MQQNGGEYAGLQGLLGVLVHLVQKHTKQEKHRKTHIVFAKQKNKRKSRHISAEDVKNSVCAYAQKEKKHRKTVHKAPKYGIINPEKREQRTEACNSAGKKIRKKVQ